MLNIEIKSIPHTEQRYETVGDYWDEKDSNGEDIKRVRVSEMEDWRYEFLVAVHELIEEAIARYRGKPEPATKAFDEQFERERAEGKHAVDDEPGDDLACPVWQEHQIATGIERVLAGLLGVHWDTYDKVCTGLFPEEIQSGK